MKKKEKKIKNDRNNTLCGGYDYFDKAYSEKDIHDVSAEYSDICPNCGSKNLHLLAADCGAWDWVLQQCIDCTYIFVYGWSSD